MTDFDSTQHPRNHPTGKSRFSDKLQGAPDDSVAAGITEPRPFTGPFTAELSEQEQEFAEGMALLYKTSLDANLTRAGWMSRDTFTCDGGAVAAKLLADRLGIPARLEVGLYWHTNAEMRADIMGYTRDDDDSDEEWEAVLDEVRELMDEHHHWVILNPGTDDELLVDPNGPARDEQHFIRARDDDGLAERYEWRPEYIIYDPAEGAQSIAAWAYPGLEERIQAL